MLPLWLFWSPTTASHSIFRAFKFHSHSVEQEFQQSCNRLHVMLATAYFTFSTLLNLVHAASYSGNSSLPVSFWCYVATSVLPAVALLLLQTVPLARQQVVLLHAGVVMSLLLMACYMSCAIPDEWLVCAVIQLEGSFPVGMVAEVSDLLATSFSNQARTSMAYSCQYHLISLSFMGYNNTTVPVWLSFFSSFVVAAFLSPHRAALFIGLFSSQLLLSIIPFLVLCICVEVLQRSYFHSQRELKRELEVSQMAEGMLNNTVKNALADAVANVQEYLNAGTQAAECLLQETLAGLGRGMRCCRQRQAFLALVSDTYEPHFQQTSLRSLGEDLVAGRLVEGDFAEGQVLLDPLLCNLVLENALAQAFQHGRLEGSDIRVRIFLEVMFPAATMAAHSAVQVVFEVSFVYGGGFQPWTLPSNCMTQRHLKLAADAHGMAIHWSQEADRVIFRAVCATQQAERWAEPPPKPTLEAFPPLTFYIIDDSTAARRLLATSIARMATPAAVHCYGTHPQDIHQFVGAASLDGDVVICDQHLDYGEQRFLGSDLIRSLRDRGFQGLLCMRSADVDEHDRELYRACGAHCTFGKEVLCREVVESIKAAYVELKGLHPSCENMSPMIATHGDSLANRPQVSPGFSVHGWDSTEHVPTQRGEECVALHTTHHPFTSF